ncbi:MAG: hypothetical protein ACXIUW_18445 [Roseinatronobacter sp.]
MTVSAFQPRLLTQKAAGFSLAAGLRVDLGSFTPHTTHDLIRQTPVPSPDPEAGLSPSDRDRDTAATLPPEPEAAPAPPMPSAAPPPAPASPATKDALAAAYQDGARAARAEADARLAESCARLDAASAVLTAMLEPLTQALETEIAALGQALESAVYKLASERAGQEISRDPHGFGLRICRLAERVADTCSGMRIDLNPQDLEALQGARDAGQAAEFLHLFDAHLHAAPDLSRGDLRLRSTALELEDIISAGAGA